MSILVVGSVAFDSIKTPFGEKDYIIGGSATYFSVAASFFTDVRVVAVVGNDFGPEEEAIFRQRHIDISDLERIADQKSFYWKGEYGYDLNVAHTLDTQLNVFADFKPKLSAAARQSPYLFLGNIQPELQIEVCEQVGAKLVAADTMNYWIEKTRPQLLEMLKRIDILIINDSEAREIAQEANLIRAARRILSLGPKRLVVKRGEYGARRLRRTLISPSPPIRLRMCSTRPVRATASRAALWATWPRPIPPTKRRSGGRLFTAR